MIVEEIEFAESKSSQSNNNDYQPQPSPQDNDGFMNIPDGIPEELPFS